MDGLAIGVFRVNHYSIGDLAIEVFEVNPHSEHDLAIGVYGLNHYCIIDLAIEVFGVNHHCTLGNLDPFQRTNRCYSRSELCNYQTRPTLDYMKGNCLSVSFVNCFLRFFFCTVC